MESSGIIQVGVIVKDIEQSAKNWAEVFDLPVPKINQVRPLELTGATYGGKPMTSRAKLCGFRLGNVQVELCQPDGEDSIWKELLETRGEGVQFLGFLVPNAKEATDALAEKGVSIAQWGDTGGGTYSMMRSMEKLGVALNIKDKKENKE